jgi:hypothetical protein
MKKMLMAALCALAAACGGGDDGGVDPTKVTFTYPAPSAPAAYSPEAQAALAGEAALADTQTIQTETIPAEAVQSQSIFTLPELIADEAMPSSGLQKFGAAEGVAQKAIAAALGGVQAAYDPGCVTVTPGAITYANCTDTLTDPSDGSTMTATTNGSLTRTFTVGGAVLAWNLAVQVTMTDPESTMRVNDHFTGTLTVAASTIVGASRSDLGVSFSMQGLNVSGAVTHLGDYDLDYTTDPAFCLTGGTLEVRRVWTQVPQYTAPGEAQDLGIRFTFGPGCGLVQAAWGVR